MCIRLTRQYSCGHAAKLLIRCSLPELVGYDIQPCLYAPDRRSEVWRIGCNSCTGAGFTHNPKDLVGFQDIPMDEGDEPYANGPLLRRQHLYLAVLIYSYTIHKCARIVGEPKLMTAPECVEHIRLYTAELLCRQNAAHGISNPFIDPPISCGCFVSEHGRQYLNNAAAAVRMHMADFLQQNFEDMYFNGDAAISLPGLREQEHAIVERMKNIPRATDAASQQPWSYMEIVPYMSTNRTIERVHRGLPETLTSRHFEQDPGWPYRKAMLRTISLIIAMDPGLSNARTTAIMKSFEPMLYHMTTNGPVSGSGSLVILPPDSPDDVSLHAWVNRRLAYLANDMAKHDRAAAAAGGNVPLFTPDFWNNWVWEPLATMAGGNDDENNAVLSYPGWHTDDSFRKKAEEFQARTLRFISDLNAVVAPINECFCGDPYTAKGSPHEPVSLQSCMKGHFAGRTCIVEWAVNESRMARDARQTPTCPLCRTPVRQVD